MEEEHSRGEQTEQEEERLRDALWTSIVDLECAPISEAEQGKFHQKCNRRRNTSLDPQFHVLHSWAWRCAHYLKELGWDGRIWVSPATCSGLIENTGCELEVCDEMPFTHLEREERGREDATKAESNGCECNSPTGLKPAPRTSEAHRGRKHEEVGGKERKKD